MTDNRQSTDLVRWSGLLAAGGVLILVAAATFLATALYHVAQLSGYGPTYVVLAPLPVAVFAAASVVVLAGSLRAWHHSRARGFALAGRLSLVAIIVTVVAWLAVGAAFVALTGSWGAA